mmetsp:Transcript_19502/g.21812  ORF Transcript_19502/g.21812 Transcript_19502/m.21812 type:complete len:82 (+) Transcript_19502:1-246(+)|eukprot:CAMPEP_0205830080 /NCGR_PEP_ID=MMETSP0206-20130828/40001_1 /ASSEMBLY_ACC=CAM_ASM_000279 /TAXON_ID=36767 /ORGANISM="Euplotes focardii, Strain TN1" /LENGTH=81 /DNA_ID=CAMNT_0053133377 /DNA_START=1 /DNA_END=246 /DNA_ORIENTATION=+
MNSIAPRYARSAATLLRSNAFASRSAVRGGGHNHQGPGDSMPIPSWNKGSSAMATHLAVWGYVFSAVGASFGAIAYAQSKV